MKHGGYKSEEERKLLEPRDSAPNEALDDFELSLDIEPKAPRATSGNSRVTLSSLFIVCSHGRRSAHDEWWPLSGKWCPGGRPATLEDLGGEKVWWCLKHKRLNLFCPFGEEHDVIPALVIPLPQMVAGESL